MVSNPIKILHLNYEYSSRDTDLSNAITAALMKKPFSVTTVYLQGDRNFVEKGDNNSTLNYFFNFNPQLVKGNRIKIIKSIIKFCKKEKFDVVITHRFKPCYLIAFAGLLIKFKKKISVFHGSGEFDRPYRKFLARIFMRSFQIVAVSRAVKEDLLKAHCGFKSNQITVIHNAINAKEIEGTQLSREEARQKLGLPANQFIFGQIARLTPSKGQEYLIQAFSQCNTPDAHLVIIGGGRLENALREKIISLNLQSRVHLIGEISNAYRYVKAFDVFVSSSIKEGFGVVLLEAMAGSIPIIATNIEGIPEVVETLAPLCPAKDSHALKELMQQFYQQDKITLQQKGQRLNQRLHESFDITAYQHAFRQLCYIDKPKFGS